MAIKSLSTFTRPARQRWGSTPSTGQSVASTGKLALVGASTVDTEQRCGAAYGTSQVLTYPAQRSVG